MRALSKDMVLFMLELSKRLLIPKSRNFSNFSSSLLLAYQVTRTSSTSAGVLTQKFPHLSCLRITSCFTGSSLSFPTFNLLVSPARLGSEIANKMTSEGEQQGQAQTPTAGDRDKCVFCKIADGKEENEIFYQDEEVVVFQDIRPAAKHHLLVVTREHIRDSKSLTSTQLPLAKRLVEVGKQVLLNQIKKESPEVESLPADLQILMGYHWPPFHTVSHLHLHVIAPSDQMGFFGRTIFRPNNFWFVTPEYIHDRLEKMAATEKST